MSDIKSEIDQVIYAEDRSLMSDSGWRRRDALGIAPALFAMQTSVRAAVPAADVLKKSFGFDPQSDYPLVEQPKGQPTFGENHAFWLFDERSRIYINTHVNSIEDFWPLRRETLSVTLSDGRALVDMDDGRLTTSRIAGGANFAAECIEPFRRWRLSYAGTMAETTQAALAAGPLATERRVLVDWDADVICPVPPFQQGKGAEGGKPLAQTIAGRFMGGSRYEQLFRAQVRFRIHGEDEIRFSATGTRTHRQGARDITGFAGHDWKSAIFPNGDAFNLHRYRTPEDGVAWSEAFLIKNGVVYPARVIEDTWMTSRQTHGEQLPIKLASELGETKISGETLGSIFRGMNAQPGNPFGRIWGVRNGIPGALALSQSWARFGMEGQSANGLCERSILMEKLT